MAINPFSRRAILGLFGTGAAAATAIRVSSNASADEPEAQAGAAAQRVQATSSRGELARQPASPGATWRLNDGARSGDWTWQTGDFAARIAADPLQGLYIKHAEVSPATGAWARDWDGLTGRPEWFGATANAPDFDNQPALQAAVNLCATVQLGPGSYHVTRRIQILKNGTHLLGAGLTQTDQGPNDNSTQIVCTSAEQTIIQIGDDSRGQPKPLVEGVQLRDFTVRRGVAPFIPAAGYEGAIGIAMRWCVNCHVERVFSIDSARGWFFYGTIENYIIRCAALRGRQGSYRANDSFIGFHLDYTAPLAANGGNASLYINHCRAFGGFGEGTPDLTYSAGLRTDGGWVDLYIDALETGTLQYGIDGHGDAYDGGASFKTEDLIITNCVLDPGTLANIRLQTADTSSAIQISNNYLAVTPSGTSIVLQQLGGSVSLTANQCIIGSAGGTGLSAMSVNNLRCTNNIYTKLKQPIRLENVTSFHLQDTIHSLDTPNSFAGIGLINCTRGKVDCILNGRAGSNSRGVHLVGTGNSLIEVNCTNLQASAFSQGAAGKLVNDKTPVTVAGPFGNDCLASGIMR